MSMPGDGRVTIKIDFDVDDSGLVAARTRLRALSADADRLSSRLKKLSGAFDEVEGSVGGLGSTTRKTTRDTDRFADSSDRLNRRMKRNNKDFDIGQKIISGFGKVLSTTLKFGLIGAAIEFAAVGIALSTVNGLLLAGRGAMKAYQFTMSGLSAVTAAAVVGLSAVAAAQREYNAALVAHRYQSAPQFGQGTSQAMMAMRMLTSDTQLAMFGMEALNQTFAAVSKNAELTGSMTSALRGIGDFAVTSGQDIGKSMAAAGNFIGLLQKEGKVTQDVLASAGEVSTEFQKAVENAQKMGLTSAEQLVQALSSGVLSDSAGIGQALETVNMTLMGRAKAFFTQSVSMFADFGSSFLPEITVAFDRVTSIIRRLFFRMSGDIAAFGVDSLLDKTVDLIDRLATGVGNLFGKYLPGADGMLEGLGNVVGQVVGYFRDFRAALEELSGGARVLTDTFGPPLIQIFTGFAGSMRSFNDILLEDPEKWRSFGEALTTMVEGIQDAFNAFKEFISENMGFFEGLARVIDKIAGAISFLLSLLGGIAGLNSFAGAIAGILGIGGLAMGMSRLNQGLGRQGGRLSAAGDVIRNKAFGTGPMAGGMANSMQVTASTVYVNGPIAGTGAAALAPGSSRAQERAARRAARRAGVPYQPALPGMANAGYGPGASGTAAEQAAQRSGFMSRMRPQGAMGGGYAMAGSMLLQSGLMASGSEPNLLTMAGFPLAMVNPMLGLGVSGIGTALGSQTPVGGLLSGGLGGAAVGFTIGSMIGTPILGAILAGVFSVIGGSIGFMSGRSAQQETQNDAALLNQIQKQRPFIQNLGALSAGGNGGMARTMLSQRTNTLNLDPFAYQNGVDPQEIRTNALELGQMAPAIEGLLGNFEKNVAQLEVATGKTRNEIIELANSLGFDLQDRVYELSEAIEGIGVTIPKTIEELNSTLSDLTLKSWTDILQPVLDEEAGKKAVNAATEAVAQKGGALNREEVATYLQDIVGGLTQMSGGDPFKVAQEMLNLYGTQARPGAAFQEGGALAGITMPQEFWDLLSAGLGQNLGTVASQVGAQFGAFSGQFGLSETISGDQVSAILNVMGQFNPQQMLDVSTKLSQIMTDPAFADRVRGTEDAATRTQMIIDALAGAGIIGDVTGEPPPAPTPSLTADAFGLTQEQFDLIKQNLAGGITTALNTPPTWLSQGINLNNPFVRITNVGAVEEAVRRGVTKPTNDTPTSRLASTMMRHGAYDSMLAGTRTVTSSLRSTNLGSLNSDHATGNAYDLVGQNLVGYAAMVNRTGGFAEFHGAGSGRHLHVVPGAPMGDAMSPVAMPVVTTGGGSSTSYSIQINAAPGQDPNAIANAVMAKIDQRDRNTRERS